MPSNQRFQTNPARNSVLDALYPELAGYDELEAAQLGTKLVSSTAKIAITDDRVSLVGDTRSFSPMSNEYLLIESLSGDVAASFEPLPAATWPDKEQSFSYETLLGEEFSGQLFSF